MKGSYVNSGCKCEINVKINKNKNITIPTTVIEQLTTALTMQLTMLHISRFKNYGLLIFQSTIIKILHCII